MNNRSGWASFFGTLLVGAAVIVGLIVTGGAVAALTAPLWATHLPPGDTAKGRIARIAWDEYLPFHWDAEPHNISAKVCGLVDGALRDEILNSPDQSWQIDLGTCFFTEERSVVVRIDGQTGACTATVDEPPPSCSL